MLTEKELSVGLLVSHKKWGLGKVLQLRSEDVWIYFKDIEGTPKDAVKHLKRRVAPLTLAAQQSDSALDNLPPMVRDGRLELRNTPRITERRAVDIFVGCLRCLLLVICTHPFAKAALTLHLARSEGRERYFGCNLMQRKVLRHLTNT